MQKRFEKVTEPGQQRSQLQLLYMASVKPIGHQDLTTVLFLITAGVTMDYTAYTMAITQGQNRCVHSYFRVIYILNENLVLAHLEIKVPTTDRHNKMFCHQKD